MSLTKNLWVGLLVAIALYAKISGMAGVSADEPAEKKAVIKNSLDEVYQTLESVRAEHARLLREGKKEEAQKLAQHAEELARNGKGKSEPKGDSTESLRAEIKQVQNELREVREQLKLLIELQRKSNESK